MPYDYQIPFQGYNQLRYAPQMPLQQTVQPPNVAGSMLRNGQMNMNAPIGMSNQSNPQYTMQSKRQFGNIDYNHIQGTQMLLGIGDYFAGQQKQNDARNYQRIQNNPLGMIPNNPNTSNQALYGQTEYKKGGKKMADGGMANFDDFDEEDFQDLKDQMDKFFSGKGQEVPEEAQAEPEDKDQVQDAQDADQDQPMNHGTLDMVNGIQQQEFEPDTQDDNDEQGQYIQAPSLSSIPGSSMPDMSGHPLLQQFKQGIANVENAGYGEANKHSSAFGKYQFTAPTLEAVREQQFKDIPKKDFQEAYRNDPKFQERVMDAYGTHLLSKYPDPHQAATAFFLGEGKANYYNQPNYRPTPNNLTVGSYLNNFDQGYGKRKGGYIMEDGGTGPGKQVPQQPNKPTSADSLALYNNAKQVAEYYNNSKYKLDPSGFLPPQHFDMYNQQGYQGMQERLRKNEYPNTDRSINSKPDNNFKIDEYRKDINSNQYLQREFYNGMLDLRAPMTLYDKRITPQSSVSLENMDTNDKLYGDIVGLHTYDTLAVKPWNMLTPQERQLRIQKYGDPNKKPKNLEDLGNDPNNWKTVVPGLKVNYQPAPPIAKRSQVQEVQRSPQYTPNITGGPMNPQSFSSPKSNFSITGRDDNGQQETRYMSDLDTWRQATNQLPLKWRETTNNDKEAHAVVDSFREGGTYNLTNGQIQSLRKQGYQIDIIK